MRACSMRWSGSKPRAVEIGSSCALQVLPNPRFSQALHPHRDTLRQRTRHASKWDDENITVEVMKYAVAPAAEAELAP